MKRASAIATLIALSACATRINRAEPSAIPTSPSSVPTVSSTSSCPETAGGSAEVGAFLVDVRVGQHDSYDRITFEFKPRSGSAAGIPSYTLGNTSPPFRKDPSDEPMQVEGQAFLRLNMKGASGVDQTGTYPTETYAGPKRFRPSMPVLEDLAEQGDFESAMSWVIGLKKTRCPAVSTAINPSRLIIDLPD